MAEEKNMQAVGSVTSAKTAAGESSSAKNGKLHFDYKKILDLNTSEATLTKMAEDLAANANTNEIDLAMFSHYMTRRTNAAVMFSNVMRAIADAARAIIQNIRA